MTMTGRPRTDESPWSHPADFRRTLDLAQGGDAEALELLFRHFYPIVQQLVHASLTRDLRAKRPWLASLFSTGDIVQDVFKDTLKDITSFHGASEREFVGFLAALVRNRLIDSIRYHQAALRDRRMLRKLGDGIEPASAAPGPATGLVKEEELEAFQQALSSFPDRERLLLRERLEYGTQFQNIAERLGYPSADSARKAFNVAQARLLIRLRGTASES